MKPNYYLMKYTLAAVADGKVDKKTLKACDRGARANASILRWIAWEQGGLIAWVIISILSSYRKRVITKDAIEYHFKLLKS